MVSLAFRIAAFVVGLLLILLGIVGLFLPFLQGFLLIFLGLSVMSLVSERAARVLRGFKDRLRGWRHGRRGAGKTGAGDDVVAPDLDG